MLFKLDNVSLSFGEKLIFEKLFFVMNLGDKIGIIGDNGVGKSTLFNIILEKVDFQGDIIFENNDFGYLSQDEGFVDLKLISSRKKEIEKLFLDESIINDNEKYSQLIEEYNKIVIEDNNQKEIDLINLFDFNYELYLKEKKDELSGGESTKFKLIKLFLQNYNYYLLDEPSNHLDYKSKQVLVDILKTKNSYMIISHDVDLLNKCCTKIVEIKNQNIKIYNGNYDKYLEEKQKEIDEILKIQTEHQNQKNRIQNNIDNIKDWSNQKVKDKTKHLAHGQVMNDMGIGRGSMASGINSTSKKLNKMFDKINSFETPELEFEDEIKIKYFDFKKPNQIVVDVDNLKKSFDNSIKNNSIFSEHFEQHSKSFNLSIDSFRIDVKDKVAIQGDNGCGKSTFLKLILGELKPDFGNIEIGDLVKIGYLSQKNETLNLNNKVIDEIFNLDLNLDESEIRKYLGKFLFKKNDVFKTISNLSGGEKIRLALLKLILNGSNFLVLDEPSNHLDIKSKDVLSNALKDFPGPILVVSHDNYFLDKFVNKKVKIVDEKLI